MRQLLTAPIGRRREAVPTSCGPGRVGVFPARRRRNLAVLEWRTQFVAHGVERRDHVAGETAGFLQYGIDSFLVEIAIQTLSQRGFEAGGVFEAEGNIGDGSAVAHGRLI